MVREQSVGGRMKPDLYITLYTEIYSRDILELNIKGKILIYKVTQMY